ncbi:MAG: metalloregulator ArsR/SmtB family transcription factor [Spirochaetota bacterium]
MMVHQEELLYAREAVDAFKALTDETRLRILYILTRSAFNVNEIRGILGMGQSRVSRHLKILSDAGFLSSNREGSWVYYSILENIPTSFSRRLFEFIFSQKEFSHWPDRDLPRIQEVLKEREKRNARYFNQVGKEWEEIQQNLLNPEVYRNVIVSYLPENAEHILDLGCGQGALIPYLQEKADLVTGVDISHRMIHDTLETYKEEKNVKLVMSPLENLPFADASVDAVVASMVLHHVSNPLQVKKEVNRVLREGGVFCVVDLQKHEQEFMREKFADLWLGFEYSQMENWLAIAGFAIEKTDTIVLNQSFNVLTIKAIKKGV